MVATIRKTILPLTAMALVASAFFIRDFDEPKRLRSTALGQVPSAFTRFARSLPAKLKARVLVKRVTDRRELEALSRAADPDSAIANFVAEPAAGESLNAAKAELEKTLRDSTRKTGVEIYTSEASENGARSRMLILTDGPVGEALVLYLAEQV